MERTREGDPLVSSTHARKKQFDDDEERVQREIILASLVKGAHGRQY